MYKRQVLESLLAVLALCVAGAAAAADGTPAAGTPFQIFSRGVAGFFEMFGVPVYVATVFMTMCVSALALTSLDAVARIGRMSFQELFTEDDMAHASGWRKLFCNTYFSTLVTLLFGYVLTQMCIRDRQWPDPEGRCNCDPLRGPQGRPRYAGDAGCHHHPHGLRPG